MGNVCSSGQNKKDKDNSSEKSEEWVRLMWQFYFFYSIYKLKYLFINKRILFFFWHQTQPTGWNKKIFEH